MKKTIVTRSAVALGLLVVCWLLLPGGHNHSSDGSAVAASASEAATAAGVTWYCSMTQCGVSGLPSPGKCPKCGMDLIPTDASAPKTGPREVAFTADAAKLIRVETFAARRQPLVAHVVLSGKVAEDETRRSVIAARFDGRIERLYMDHTGLRVRKGDHMADIYAPDLTLSLSTLLSALDNKSGYSILGSQDIADIRVRLLNRGLTDEQIDELLESRSMRSVFMITSPVSGVVVERQATRGQYVNEGTPLFTVADLSRVWVELNAFESDLGLLRFGQTARLAIAALPGEEFDGVVSFIDPVMDEATRSVRVRLDVANPQYRLKPGMLVKADIEVPLADDGSAAAHGYPDGTYVCPMHPTETATEPADCPVCDMAMVPAENVDLAESRPAGEPLVVPESAVLSTGRRRLLYVAVTDADGITRYEAREVIPGLPAGPYRVILSGLDDGEVVVASGAFQIDSAMQIQGKASLMQAGGAGRDPFFGPGSHDGDPAPGWYAAAERSDWRPADAVPGFDMETLVARYLEVSNALAADDGEAAHSGAVKLAGWAGQFGPAAGADRDAAFSDLLAGLKDRSARLDRADSLDAQRLAFRDLSGVMTTLLRRYGAPSGPVLSIFCPMAFDEAGHSGCSGRRRSTTRTTGWKCPGAAGKLKKYRRQEVNNQDFISTRCDGRVGF
ncbi:MAG: efflux RND transporter periplasmic adaptor subunit [Planctomycetes bacterium]|nr:efflux RND transporter periplasmic adaptor subunit [Planctomycetota bacterium]